MGDASSMFFVGVHAKAELRKKEKWVYKEEAMMIMKKKILKKQRLK